MSAIFGEQLTFAQENGPEVRLVVFGDEFYARYENQDGYTVVYDYDLGLFCYALVIDGKFVSSGVPIDQEPPPNLRRHVEELEWVRHEIFEARRMASIPPPDPHSPRDTFRTLGPNAGLLTGRRLSTGTIRGLTIMVEFQDVTSTVTQADVSDMLNGPNYTKNGNFCSAREYFQLVSSGKLDYSNEVVGPIRLSRNRQYYTTHLFVEEALTLAVAAGIDLTLFDSKGEGILDALNFMYAGQTQYIGELWPHNSFVNLRFGNMRTNLYLLTSLGRNSGDLSIGTFCHENGHLLCRFPDMYDYGNRDGDGVESAGIGAYCLMGSGNHLNRGRTPSPVCGYLRDLGGWCDNVVVLGHSGTFEAVHGDYETIFKAETDKPNEYFVIENRSKLGLDTHLPASGLAIYHCDTKGSNEWQEGSTTRHYQCALLQADGHLDLEHNLNQGDGTDLFHSIAGVAISDVSTPSSRQWDGADSGLMLSKISGPGAKMSFSVGAEVSTQIVQGEAVPALTIPDNDVDGITSTIEIDQMGTAQQVKVGVDITHPFIGDLVVELMSPTSQMIPLHSRTGAGSDNLIKSYDSMGDPALAALMGKPIQGTWVLQVKDVARRDTGKLNRWSLAIGVGESQSGTLVRGESSPDLKIPDDNRVGVSSTIAIDQPGIAKQVKVSINITHTYIGDLRVELLSPTGRAAILHNQLGGNQDNLVMVHDSTTPSSALLPLVGQPMQGDWILRVTDLAGQDVGTLNNWNLELTSGG